MSAQDLYQSILLQISLLPTEYLERADELLKQLAKEAEVKQNAVEQADTPEKIDDESVWDEITVEYRQDRHNYQGIGSVDQKIKKVTTFAGAWEDMPQKDFDEYLAAARQTGNKLIPDKKQDL